MHAALADANVDPETADPLQVASLFVRKKLLTKFQAMQLLNGRTKGFVLDQYRILDSIRQDRVGMVFKAEDTGAKQLVSLKVLPTDRASDPSILQAFMREVRAAARVNHPNVARVLDVGCWQGTHFVVAEYVPGITLDKFVADKGPLPPRVAAQVVAQVAVGLMHAHNIGLIHRDVTPNNIVLTQDRQAKLIDLGLTHMLESPWGQVTKRLNTKEYAEEIAHIAPEQAWGRELDARSDIYSLSSTFYYMLTGAVPFPGLAPEVMTERQVRGVPSPAERKPEISAPLDAVVRKMGEKEPKARYQTAREVLLALRAWLPAAQCQALGLAVEEPAPAVETKLLNEEPAKSSGFFALVRRFLGR
jgi:serine/threonine-protein kinase